MGQRPKVLYKFLVFDAIFHGLGLKQSSSFFLLKGEMFVDTSAKKKKEYQKTVEILSPNSHIVKNCFKAFFSGGAICTVGQVLNNWFLTFGLGKDNTSILVNLVLIGIAAILTGTGLYSRMGHYCGAGTIVPITGFANSMVSPAIEFKTQGLILGVGAKMFTVAGPVIVY